MGAQIAAHLANAGCRVHLLDVVPAGATGRARSSVAAGALKQLAKAKPPPLMWGEFVGRITPGNLEDDLTRAVSTSAVVIEAVVERLDIKRDLFNRVAAAAGPNCVLASNTSGIPIGDIAEALPPAARERFLGLHFFNPPRFMHLLEVVPSRFTAPAHVDAASQFCERVLGKGVVLCRDTPNFIGNRIGIAEMLLTFAAAKRHGLTVEQVDLLNGKLMGRPKTGSFRLGDMVGLDIVAHVVGNLQTGLSNDPSAPNFDPLYDAMVVPDLITTMLSRKMIGDKTGGGFYRKDRNADGSSKILALDLDTLEYRDSEKARFDELKQIARMPKLDARIAAALQADGKPGEFLRDVYLPLFNYAAHLSGTICDTPKQIDDAMCWGYGWQLGPFALWDAAGLSWAAQAIEARGDTLAPLAKQLLASGQTSWFAGEPGQRTVFVGGDTPRHELPTAPGVIQLDAVRSREHAIIDKNPTANLVDIGDGIACIEFRSKMNTLDEGVVRMLGSAVDTLVARGDFRGVVIGSQSGDFSAGANLLQILGWINQKKFDDIEAGVKLLQDTFMGLQHAPLPVVAAPYGRTLGGGVELSLHCDEIQAGAELYMGLVELGVGLLPAGGGLKEICRRASVWARQVPEPDPYPFVRRGFENAAMAKVSMSAFEAKQMGLLAPDDGVTFHRDHLLAAAKRRCLALAERGYVPLDPSAPIDVVGAPRGASFMLGAQLFAWGGYASEHDKLIGRKIAHVLSGGMPVAATQVTAQHLLDLEREAFVSLCGEAKTAARIMHMLETNKPLRN